MIWINQVLSDFAGKTLKNLLNETPYPDFYNLYGIFQAEQEQYEKAKESFQKAIDINKYYLLPRLNSQYIGMVSGKPSLNDIPVKMILATRPLVETQLLAVELLLMEDRIKEASQILERILKISSDYPEVFLLKGITLVFSGKKKLGEKEIQKACLISNHVRERTAFYLKRTRLDRENGKEILKDLLHRAYVMPLLTEMTGFCASRGNYVLAGRFLERAKESNPDSPSFLNLLGDLACSTGNKKEAEKNYLVADKRDPRCAYAAIKLSFLYGEKGKIDKSLSVLKRSAHMNPLYADLHSYLGEAYIAKRKFTLAEKHFKKSLSINPRYSKAWMNLAELYENMKKWDGSFKACLKVVSIGRQTPRFLVEMIKRTFQKSSFSKDKTLLQAIEEYKKANEHPGIEKLMEIIKIS
ncbi:MAG: tetratricopeptide repeat protein [Candidatus Aureabacteria bacterium]|nr:tetratricopeptide repeat protein [Candidatus Auribacterota bacterium]